MGNTCSVSETNTKGQGCPAGFTFTFDCESSWLVNKIHTNVRCEAPTNPSQYSGDWPEGLDTEYDAPIVQGSRYTVVGKCSGTGWDWEDKTDVAPPCKTGDTEVGTRESPCGSHMFGTAGTSGGRQVRACNDESSSGSYPVISVQKRGANCAAGSGFTWSFNPEYSCDYLEGQVSDVSKVVDCWIPYVVTSNNECIAYNPKGAGWLRTWSDEGIELDGQFGRPWPYIEYGGVEGPVGADFNKPVTAGNALTPPFTSNSMKAGAVSTFLAPAAVLGAFLVRGKAKRQKPEMKVEMKNGSVV